MGARVVIDFEGRDAAAKGGMIRAITERVSPRAFGLVALPAPSDRERTQIYSRQSISAIGSTMSLR
jgi:polyphosphate kinase 2 (PPK2 family)